MLFLLFCIIHIAVDRVLVAPGPGEDDEEEDLYSPVSPETPPSSSTDDYDDVLNP